MARKSIRSRIKAEFRPDKREVTWLKALYMTRQQRFTLLKWTLYTVLCLLMLVIQDVIMSRFTIFGSTTDLAVAAILLITLVEGGEAGCVFVLIASTMYFFSGSSPGAFCIAAMTFLGVFTTVFRQMYWRRNFASIVLCAAVNVMVYELITFAAGIAMGFTILSRVGVFAVKGLLTCVILLPLYPLVFTIGKIGGKVWKE